METDSKNHGLALDLKVKAGTVDELCDLLMLFAQELHRSNGDTDALSRVYLSPFNRQYSATKH